MDPPGLLPQPDGEKEARFHRVAEAIAVVLQRHGPDALQVADVARRAEVSRAWIYKYVGSDRTALVGYAVRLFGTAFAAPASAEAPGDPVAWRLSLVNGTRKGLRDTLAAPWCVLVYHRYRHTPGELGDRLRALEEDEVGRLVDRIPPPVRADRNSALRFARIFHVARLGLFHAWLDPAFRMSVGEDAAIETLLGLVDAWITR